MKVLMVEPDLDLSAHMSVIISSWGHQVAAAASAAEALELARNNRFQSALVHVSPAEERDLELIAALGRACPGLLVAALNPDEYYLPEFEARLRQAGVFYYTIKPSGAPLLFERILDHLLFRLGLAAARSGNIKTA